MSVFNVIAQNNYWGSEETVSGPGSTLDTTQILRKSLMQVFAELNIRTIVDAPCGDMNWMRQLGYPFEKYIGIDVVPMLIEKLRSQQFPAFYHFQVGNIVTDILPTADALFCRDCLVHLPFLAIQEAKKLWKLAGFKYVFATTFPQTHENQNIKIGEWRPLNMEIAPFHWSKPRLIIAEYPGSAPLCGDKSIGVWEL